MTDQKMKAFGTFIFGGSATFGAEDAGFKVDKVLEMTDTMTSINGSAYHFAQNRKDIKIELPSDWENGLYFSNMASQDYDLMFANCPCSGLSQINRNASVDNNKNSEFYRVFNIISETKPKTFVVENAPTLIKLGYPLVLDMVNRLGHLYKFTVIRDYAGHHNVSMRRMRTLLVGWRRDVFNNKIPLLHMNKKPLGTIREAIGDLYDKPLGDLPNHNVIPDRGWGKYDHLIRYARHDTTMLLSFIEQWDNILPHLEDDSIKRDILRAQERIRENKNIWDKSPYRANENIPAPSLTSVAKFLHPIHDRHWTIREYARLMGYPDDFVFHEECKVPVIQVIAQGVPRNFIRYITEECREALLGKRKLLDAENSVINFQHHNREVYRIFTESELKNKEYLDYDNKDSKFQILEK